MGLDPRNYLVTTSKETIAIHEAFLKDFGDQVISVAELFGKCIQQGGKVLIFGNGGSAADAQHMAAEMVGRMLVERRGLPAIALTTDTSNLTAIGNDYGYDKVFSRQIQALARPGDVVFAISTSGNSENVFAGVQEAKKLGCHTVGLTGGSGGRLKEICDICLVAARGTNSSRIQETHIFAIHSIVDILDKFFLELVESNPAVKREKDFRTRE